MYHVHYTAKDTVKSEANIQLAATADRCKDSLAKFNRDRKAALKAGLRYVHVGVSHLSIAVNEAPLLTILNSLGYRIAHPHKDERTQQIIYQVSW